MAATGSQGPLVAYGSLASLLATTTGAALGGEQHVGPSQFYQGNALPMPNFLFNKEMAGGWKGVSPAQWQQANYRSAVGYPATHATNNIVVAAHTVSGQAMTLVSTPSFGVSVNVPIIPTTATGNAFGGAAVTTAPVVLDFGFALATLVSGSTTATVADSSLFVPGMPLCFMAIATQTTAFLTTVISAPTATTLTLADAAPWSAASGGARVGTANIWQPNEGLYATPTAAWPALGAGNGLFFDPRQMIARGLVCTASSASGTGGAVTIKGWDAYWQPMTETITITPGTATTAYGIKAWKAVSSVVPAFTDATYNYTVGTSDVFGFNTKATQIENTEIWWAAALNTAATGFTAGLAAGTPSTATTADVRGTIQVSAIGAGTGIGSTASNGSQSTTSFTGNVLSIMVRNALPDVILAGPLNPASLLGNAQF